MPGYEVGIARRFVPNPWTELRELQLSMETNTFCNLADVASFLASCTNLEKLFIDVSIDQENIQISPFHYMIYLHNILMWAIRLQIVILNENLRLN